MVGRGAAGLKNTAVTLGSTATLHCTNINSISSSRPRVHWDNYAQRNPTIYNGHEVIEPLRSRYRVNSSTVGRHRHRDELVIRDVRMSDAGNYSCYAQSRQPRITALLIVLSTYVTRSLS